VDDQPTSVAAAEFDATDVSYETTHALTPADATAAPAPAPESPLTELQRTVRRQQAQARDPREDLVWQSRFAYSSAAVIFVAFTAVSLPLWLVLYRISGSADNPPRVGDLVALCMMLMGGILTGAATWVIIIEMRGRVRMVDTLAKTGEREAMSTPELPVLDRPTVPAMATSPAMTTSPAETGTGVGTGAATDADVPAVPAAGGAEPVPFNPAATLEASSKLLASFSSVLRSFGQLAAQVAMLTVALALFVGATILSLR
jgi:hypothetical protein